MSKTIAKMCYDRVLPEELRSQGYSDAHRSIMRGGRPRAIMPIGKRWPNGTKLGIRFLGGTSAQHDEVARVAVEWEKHTNLKLNFNEAPDAEIRIAFENDGAWSYLGTDNLNIPRHAATMNFGFMGEGTILHEFGHALGLSHEHQNPDGGMQWNEAEVIRSLSGPPNFWNEAQIRHNVLRKYSLDQINGTSFDPDSIMLYAFPAAWTTNGVSTHENNSLSATDISFISSVYPAGPTSETVSLPINEVSVTSATIGQPGEEDLFSFEAMAQGTYVVETKGNTDVIMKLFGPNNGTNLISEDDDSGSARNARIEANLGTGKYLVQVRHYNANGGTGDYGVSVSKK